MTRHRLPAFLPGKAQHRNPPIFSKPRFDFGGMVHGALIPDNPISQEDATVKRLAARSTLSLMLVVFAALACGLPAGLSGIGSNFTKTTELWGDVPRMDGLEASDKDLPLYARVLVQAVMPRLFGDNTGTGDWILFETSQTPDDLAAFYTNDLMAENGWEASDTSTCVDGSAQGVTEAGVFCVFQKQESERYVGLVIIGGEDAETQKTNVIFIRVEAEQTPTPAGE
jgi:hypothetical protein